MISIEKYNYEFFGIEVLLILPEVVNTFIDTEQCLVGK